MNRNSIMGLVLGGILGVSAMAPAEAMPLPSAPAAKHVTDVQQARVIVRYGYYNGHRGYRYRRPGYRYYGGYWYPSIAFGPAIVVVPRARRWHWAWCGPRWDRYRCQVRY